MKRKTLLFTVVALLSLSGCTTTPTKVEVDSIKLNETSKTLTVDDTFQLTATVSPEDATDKTVTWSSSKDDVASVSEEGMVTALKAGTTTITVTSKSNNTVKATCNITVNDKVIPVTSVSLNATTKTVTEGDSFTLTATVLPENATDRTVTWSSSNTSVATVNNGVVNTLKDGTATITATSNSNSSKKATCSVTVEKAAAEVVTIVPKGASSSNREVSISKSSFTVEGTTLSSASGSRVYGTSNASDKAYRLGSSSTTGNISFNFPKMTISAITISAYTYNNDTNCGFKITAGTETKQVTVVNNTVADYKVEFENQVETTSLKVETTQNSKRVILKGITINTKPAEPVYPESITLANTEVGINETTQLTPTFTPSNTNQRTLTWDSSNKSVATVDNTGLVKGLVEGKTTITATGKDAEGKDVVGSCEVTVKTISVTGVTLSETTLKVTLGKEKTLTPTISPANATNKNVSWKSDNDAIATVTNGVIKGVAIGETNVTVTTEDGSKTATCKVTVSEEQLDDWTLLFYVCGADLESDGQCATDDIKEILAKRTSQPDSVNIVVETGGAKTWHLSGVEKDKINRFEINSSSSSMIKKQSLARTNMGDPATLQSFLEWGIDNYPAEKYGLFMWNHGGAMDGCCFDEYTNDGLYADEVYSAVSAARTTLGLGKLEFIAYDACLMAVQDVAEWNSYHFNYMLSSQETEWSGGYDYDKWLPTLYSNPSTVSTVTLLTKIADTFLDEQAGSSHYDQTQSVFDLSKMQAYKDAWETMTDALAINSSSRWSSFTTLVNKAMKYGYYDDSSYSEYNGGYLYDVFDVKGALNKVKADSDFYSASTQIDNVLTLFDQVVVYERHGSQMNGSNGMCLFCPISGYNQKAPVTYQGKTYPANYSASRTNFTKWQALCAQYGNWFE